jgi:hypothetical protein
MRNQSYLGLTLQDYRGPAKNVNGEIGIEFECEPVQGASLYPFNCDYWSVKADGSLRGGAEWVLRQPIPFPALKVAIDDFFYNSKRHGQKLSDDSIRTSIHVHVNAQLFTLVQIYTILTAYFLVENLLVRFSGKTREGNLFCLRARDADFTISSIRDSLTQGTFINHFRDHNVYKYGALNLSALARFGSFEFRSMRGYYSDPKFIIGWIEALYSLVTKAATFDNPRLVSLFFKNNSPVTFLRAFFPEEFVVRLLDQAPDYHYLMEESYHSAFAISTALDDWTVPAPEPAPKKKSRQQIVDETLSAMQAQQTITNNGWFLTDLPQATTTATNVPSNWADVDEPPEFDDLNEYDDDMPTLDVSE